MKTRGRGSRGSGQGESFSHSVFRDTTPSNQHFLLSNFGTKALKRVQASPCEHAIFAKTFSCLASTFFT